MSEYRVSVKESVFRVLDLQEAEVGEDPELVFDSKAEATAWIEELNEGNSGPGQFSLHTAHPADESGVDAYLVFRPGSVWTFDP